MDRTFLELFDRNITGKFAYLARYNPKMTLRSFGHTVVIDSGLHSNMFNIIYCSQGSDTSDLQAAIDHFRSKALPYAFWIGFEDDPPWLEKELLLLGLITDETEWAMICDLNKPLSLPQYDIRQVQDEAALLDVIHIIQRVVPIEEEIAIQLFYEQSKGILLAKECPLTFFVGYENEQPISLASLFCDQEIASIFDLIVIPEMRGKGLGKTMTLRTMQEAQKKGFTRCVLTATNDAKYLYQQLGFKELKTMKVYHDC